MISDDRTKSPGANRGLCWATVGAFAVIYGVDAA
jgi:hypothetical protein